MVDLADLPAGIKEGDLIRQNGDGFRIDKAQTEDRRRQVRDRLNRLFDKNS